MGKEERRGSSFLGEKTAVGPKQWLCHCPGHGQHSVNPRKLGREWIEQQEVVLLEEDLNQNGDWRSLTFVCTGPSLNPPERGQEAETLELGVLSQQLWEPRPGVGGSLSVCLTGVYLCILGHLCAVNLCVCVRTSVSVLVRECVFLYV